MGRGEGKPVAALQEHVLATDVERPATRHGVRRVDDDIVERLVHLTFVRLDGA